MISVVLGAAIVLTCTSAVLLVDWERLCAFVRRARGRRAYMKAAVRPVVLPEGWHTVQMPLEDGWATVCEGPGFRVVADETVNVTSKAYPNGSTQVWLKRTAA